MTTSDTSVRIESMLQCLRKIQQERTCLENKLEEQRIKRRELEQTMNSAKSELQKLQDVHTKKMEALKMEQHKAAQMQSTLDNLEALNLSKRKSVDDLNNKIAVAKETQMHQIREFEDKLTGLSSKMISARKTFDYENLQTELENACRNEILVQKKVKDIQESVEELESKFNGLKMTHDQAIDDGIPLDTRKVIWSMFNAENCMAHSCLESVEQQLSVAGQRLQGASCNDATSSVETFT